MNADLNMLGKGEGGVKRKPKVATIGTIIQAQLADRILEVTEQMDGVITSREIQSKLSETDAIVPSLPSIRKILKKELGFTFRKIRPLESYVNRLPNKILRQHAGVKMIELVSNGYVLLNMD